MTFLIALATCGSLPVCVPIINHAVLVTEFARLATIVVTTPDATANMPDEPLVWYAITVAVGIVPTACALIAGLPRQPPCLAEQLLASATTGIPPARR